MIFRNLKRPQERRVSVDVKFKFLHSVYVFSGKRRPPAPLVVYTAQTNVSTTQDRLFWRRRTRKADPKLWKTAKRRRLFTFSHSARVNHTNDKKSDLEKSD